MVSRIHAGRYATNFVQKRKEASASTPGLPVNGTLLSQNHGGGTHGIDFTQMKYSAQPSVDMLRPLTWSWPDGEWLNYLCKITS